MIYYILFFLFFIFIYKTLFKSSIEEYFKDDEIIFLSKNDVSKFLQENKDFYYNRFFPADLIARKSISVDDYKNKISNSATEPSLEIKHIISTLVDEIDNEIENKKLYWFNPKKLMVIPWKFGFFKGNEYENGLPHTRDDLILFPIERIFLDKRTKRDLLHEKIHIYQRKHPEDVIKFMDYHGYKKLRKREEKDLIRANVDTDDFIYEDKQKKIHLSKYNKENPESITDVTMYPCQTQKCEHPYEKMAIEISYLI